MPDQGAQAGRASGRAQSAAPAPAPYLLQEDYYDNPFAFNAIASEQLLWLLASLEPGDALYIPPHWWHGVIATSDEVGVTVPVTWKSPLAVIADTIRKMAAGEIDIIGTIPADYRLTLLAYAREAGVEQEMQAAWDRAACGRVGWSWGTPTAGPLTDCRYTIRKR